MKTFLNVVKVLERTSFTPLWWPFRAERFNQPAAVAPPRDVPKFRSSPKMTLPRRLGTKANHRQERLIDIRIVQLERHMFPVNQPPRVRRAFIRPKIRQNYL